MLTVLSCPDSRINLPEDSSKISPAEQLLIYGQRFTNNYADLLILLLSKTKDKNGSIVSIKTKSHAHYFVDYKYKGNVYILDPSMEEIIENKCSFRYYMLNGS